MPEHNLSVRDAQLIPTHDLQLVGQAVNFVVEHHGIGVVHGHAGLGKTFAVDAALKRLDPAPLGVRVVQMVFPHAPTTMQVARVWTQALLGEPVEGTRFKLQVRAMTALAGRRVLAVVDEAQRLTRHAMEVLRYFYDDDTTQLALLLVGGDGCWETVDSEPMLSSRVLCRRPFQRIPESQVPDVLARYHPLYVDADPALLTEVDRAYAHGNWRRWAKFTVLAYDLALASDRSTLDRAVITAVYRHLGATSP